MTEDPYKALGIARDATDKQIRAAYLKLAKTTHPDLNPGDPKAEERFKVINAANDLLSDPEQRARFDRGEIDAAGQEQRSQPPPGWRPYRDHAESAAGARYSSSFGGDDADLGDILSGLFGARGRPGMQRAGADHRYALTVSFLDAARGAEQQIVLPNGDALKVRIPAGLENNQVLRLRGKGEAGDPAGDALIAVTVAPHALFQRAGLDIHLDLPVTIAEAMLGGRITVPTLSGPVSMTIPAGSDTGTKLRLRGKGIALDAQPAGDAYVTLRVMVGPPDAALAAFLRDRTDAPVWNPRDALEQAA